MNRKRVVIVGGGYAGVEALHILASSGWCDVVLIDAHPYHYLQTDVYALIANECSLGQVSVDLVALCLSYGDHVTYIKDTIRAIDFDNRCVSGENSCHPYDYLLLSTGARTAFSASAIGLKEHSHGVKTLPSALRFKQQFEQRLYQRMESEGGWCGDPFTIVIGGGGLSGVEIAAEMAYYVEKFYRDNSLTCDNIHIYLVIPHEDILEGMDPYLIPNATKRLRSLGVRIINHSRITSVEEHRLVLNGETPLVFDFMIFTGGIVASTLTSTMDTPKNKKSQLIVDEYLSLVSYGQVFAAGDIAELRDLKGRLLPSSAQIAEQSGRCAAVNIVALINGQAMKKAPLRLKGVMIALGGKYASVSLLGWFRWSGYGAYWIKWGVMRWYRLRMIRRCKLGVSMRSAEV